MTDEEIHRCYQIWERYRWKRADFQFELIIFFEQHKTKQHERKEKSDTDGGR